MVALKTLKENEPIFEISCCFYFISQMFNKLKFGKKKVFKHHVAAS